MLKQVIDSYPLSPLQQGMLFHALREPGSGVDVEQILCDFQEDLDVDAFQRQWELVLTLHPVLRSSFRVEGMKEPIQEVHQRVELPFIYEDWRDDTPHAQEKRLQSLLQRDRLCDFDFTQAPLMRLVLVRIENTRYRFLWTFHHILLDGRSFPLVLQDVFTDAAKRPHPRPYRDFIQWIQSLDHAKSESHWRQVLEGFKRPTPLTVDQTSLCATDRDLRYEEVELRLSTTTTTSLLSMAQEHDLTPNCLLQAAWATLLARYSGETDVVFGATRACRKCGLQGIEDMIGLLINTLPMRVSVLPDTPVLPWLKGIRQRWIDMRPFELTPLAMVQGWSEIESGQPLFESLVVFENGTLNSFFQKKGGVWLNRTFKYFGQTNFPLTIIGYLDDELIIRVGFDTRRFTTENVRRILGHLEIVLGGFVKCAGKQIRDLELLTTKERNQLLDVGGARRCFNDKGCLHQIFEHQASISADAIALCFESQRLTYREVNERANQLAHHLRSLGVGPEKLVGIYMEHSVEVVLAILGVLKAGGAYVPIDPAYPEERLMFMLNDARASILLTQSSLTKKLHEQPSTVIHLDTEWATLEKQNRENLPCETTSENLAYVIYTSGSTGKPKGCLITHGNLTRLFAATKTWFEFGEDDVWTLFHSTAFDFSVWEIWGALLYGGRLVVVPQVVTRSPKDFYQMLSEEKVTILNQTPSAFRQLIQVESSEQPRPLSLRTIIFGGEALDIATLKPWFDRHGDRSPQLINMYGITETTVHVTYRPITARDLNAGSVIGQSIPDLRIYILDGNREPCPIGVPGEMYVGGAGLARGYLNRDLLTQERFVPDPFCDESGARLYRTGDMARFLDNGDIEYVGRIDQQVKLRGFRIELGEIESVLAAYPSVLEAAVVIREDTPNDKRLAAYLVTEMPRPSVEELRVLLNIHLPHYMVPSGFVFLDQLPLTNHGKLDREALPVPTIEREHLTATYAKPRTKMETTLATIWSNVLRVEKVGTNDSFFDLGGNSLLMVQVHAELQHIFHKDLSIVEMFQYPTIATLAKHLEQTNHAPSDDRDTKTPTEKQDRPEETVAIIGVHGRFPGAESVEEFWDNLINGVESMTTFSASELAKGEPIDHPDYVPRRGILSHPDHFDAAFFDIPPKEAEVIDPQQRVFLETAWEALERVGYDPLQSHCSIGVYAGMSNNTYYLNNIHYNHDLKALVGAHAIMLGNEKDYLATRVAYKLNLSGPAVSVHTACSTSLVAVCQACTALLGHECDMALAGGVSVNFPQERGYLHEEGNILSPDGHCRAFDEDAQGTVTSNGIGIVVLKRLSSALRDGDQVVATIRGSAVNNDGAGKVSFMAPSVDGQAAVIRRAQQRSGIDPATIRYVETHGTGTSLGDPIEVAALTKAFRFSTDKVNFCGIGSVKSNIGHLDAAAGVTGLIKAALTLRHRLLPPTLHVKRPSPKLALEESPFYVVNKLMKWPDSEQPRRAAVSSLGVGGTNAHVVLEEAPAIAGSSPSRRHHLLVLSAKTKSALDTMRENLTHFLQQHPETHLADMAYTLQVGRHAFKHRLAVVVEDVNDAIQTLSANKKKKRMTVHQEHGDRPVYFMFPGQGSQDPGMGAGLYKTEPVYRRMVDECAEMIQPHIQTNIRTLLFDSHDKNDGELHQTRFTQPAIFITEYALARLWISWGIQPQAMIGHSVGEYVAACLAGVFSVKEALGLVAKRALLVQKQPRGSMLAIRQNEADVTKVLTTRVNIAALNSPRLTVVAGPDEDMNDLASVLQARGIVSKRLRTSHAFHSFMMDPVLEPFTKVLTEVDFQPPTIPYISNVTGKWITNEEAMSPDYWASHVRKAVRFSEGLGTLLANPSSVLLEVGPGSTLTTLSRQHDKATKDTNVVTSLPRSEDHEKSEPKTMVKALGELWLAGAAIDWKQLYDGQRRLRVPLPTYPFERRHFCAPSVSNTTAESAPERTQPTHVQAPTSVDVDTPQATTSDSRFDVLLENVVDQLNKFTGTNCSEADPSENFLELGFDSLMLTQASIVFTRHFGLKMTFRQLMEDLTSIETLVNYLDAELPADKFAPRSTGTALDSNAVVTSTATDHHSCSKHAPILVKHQELTQDKHKTFGPFRPIHTTKEGSLTNQQLDHLNDLITNYAQRTAGSKSQISKSRPVLADPRAAAGFNPLWKEIVYPIVANRSQGSKIWDVDNNEYVDVTLGFGLNLFGHRPAFVVRAIEEQLKHGIEIGPSHPLAREVATLISEFSGMERVSFCNTGSEAVTAALRIARTVTGRDRLAMFTGAYHGIFDEVLVRPLLVNGELRSVPIAPGIAESMVDNMIVLEYGNPESLEIIRQYGDQLAGVLVEPVQSRRPELQPVEFLKGLREMTQQCGSALIFDEIVTGFRSHLGGTQALFDIHADIVTYGKVVGGGLPIGIVAGRPTYMDALDGGSWNYGDNSFPEVGVTFFAGTFVRHPLALAAAKSVLLHLKDRSPQLQESLNKKTAWLVREMNLVAETSGVPFTVTHFSSLFYINFSPDLTYASLFFYHMRLRGIHIWESRGSFLSTAHTEEDIDRILAAFKESVQSLQAGGFFPETQRKRASVKTPSTPPIPEARLGRDPSGSPAWFIPDPDRPGKYRQLK